MKYIMIVLLLILDINAFTVKNIDTTLPESFIMEYGSIIKKMESVCTDSILNVHNNVYDTKSVVLIKVKVDCDYTVPHKLLKTFYAKYIEYFKNSNFDNIIDSTTKSKFPQYELIWGTRFNNTTDPYIERILPYATTLGNNNKSIFYSVVADYDTIGTILTSFNGHSLDYMDYDHVSNVFYYRINTNKKHISDVNIYRISFYGDNYIVPDGRISNLD